MILKKKKNEIFKNQQTQPNQPSCPNSQRGHTAPPVPDSISLCPSVRLFRWPGVAMKKKCFNFKQTKRLHLPVSNPVLNGVSLLGEKKFKNPQKTFIVFAFSAKAWAFSSGRVRAWKSVTCVTVCFLRRMLFPSSRAARFFSPLAVVVDYYWWWL